MLSKLPLFLTFNVALALTIGTWSPLSSAKPAFDCSKADSDVETLICEDGDLQELDRRLAKTWAQATANWPPEVTAEQRAIQRGWIKGRNDCWKAEDMKECVTFAYNSRLVELSITAGLVEAPDYQSVSCDDDYTGPFTAVFYNTLSPRAAVFTRGNDQVIALAQPVASGMHYVGDGVDFRGKGSEGTFDWFGKSLTCQITP